MPGFAPALKGGQAFSAFAPFRARGKQRQKMLSGANLNSYKLSLILASIFPFLHIGRFLYLAGFRFRLNYRQLFLTLSGVLVLELFSGDSDVRKMDLFLPPCTFFLSRSAAMAQKKAFGWKKNLTFFPLPAPR